MSITFKKSDKLVVGRPELPNIKDVNATISRIWKTETVTNFGEYEKLFETKLKAFLGVDEVVLFCNGTSALEALLYVMQLRSKLVIPAYSFMATLSAVLRNNLTPQFVDVSKDDGNIDDKKLLEMDLKKTDAVLGVHAYGFACRVEQINEIARANNLPVIYDAAHTMGALYKGNHLSSYGLASIISFHATKIFSTIEGGAVITNDPSLALELRKFRNFGFAADKKSSTGLGTNGKLSEVHAAIGVLQLENFHLTLNKRKELFNYYEDALSQIVGVNCFKPITGSEPNGSYFPIFLEKGADFRCKLIEHMERHNISTKPYFDIDLSQIHEGSLASQKYPGTQKLTESVLCLPIHSSMNFEQIRHICNVITQFKGL